MSDPLATALADLEEATALKLVQRRLDAGEDPLAVVTSCREGMAMVGQRYEAGEYFVSELIMAGEVPASVFAAGTPEDIYNYVRNLVGLFGSTGLVLCPGCDAPINTKPENMEAFVAASREYGKVA